MAQATDVRTFREEFPVTQDWSYLNHAAYGPFPQRKVRVRLGRRRRDLHVYGHPRADIRPVTLDLPDSLGLQEPLPHHPRLPISSNQERCADLPPRPVLVQVFDNGMIGSLLPADNLAARAELAGGQVFEESPNFPLCYLYC